MRSLFRLLTYPFRLLWRMTADGQSPAGASFMIRNPLVIDGDTIWTDGLKIRIWGIDAPEMAQGEGQASKHALAALCANRNILVSPIDRDVYGRLVARLYYGRGDIGQQMVAGGRAISVCREYAGDERLARKARAGFWRNGGIGETPRDFRKRNTT